MSQKLDLRPDDWDEVAYAIKQDANWKCEICGKQCRHPRESFETGKDTLKVLCKDGDPFNQDRSNLQALCPGCYADLR